MDATKSAAEPAASATVTPETIQKPLSAKRQHWDQKRRQREERFRQVKELTAQGLSGRVIACRLGMSPKVVVRYRRLDRCPDWEPGRVSPTRLDPFASLLAEWIAAGNRNSADLFRLLKTRGCRGGYDSVRRFVNRRIGSYSRPGRRTGETQLRQRSVPSVRKLSFRVANPKPGSRSTRVLARLRERRPQLNSALALAGELMVMFRQSSTALADWTSRAVASGDVGLKNLAASLLDDAAAVEAAMSEPWSKDLSRGMSED